MQHRAASQLQLLWALALHLHNLLVEVQAIS